MSSLSENLNALYYNNTDFHSMHYLGVQTLKNPADLWVYQEILYDVKPELIIESGTFMGGTTLYLAHLLRHVNPDGRIVSIDIEPRSHPIHPRIEYLTGSSISREIYDQVVLRRERVNSCLVILDSLHTEEHVSAELQLYAPLVSVGSYIIVEDTNLNGHPVRLDYGRGAWDAVHHFLEINKKFIADPTREHYLITFNPSGYLLRTGTYG